MGAFLRTFVIFLFLLTLLACSADVRSSHAQITFERRYGEFTPNGGAGYSVLEVSSGGYIVSGTKGGEFCLMKVDSVGNVLWDASYGSGHAYSLSGASDGGFIMAGDVGLQGNVKVVKTDSAGIVLWDTVFGGGYDWASSICETYDKGYVGVGGTFSHGDDGNIYFFKMDSSGGVLWDTVIGGPFAWERGECVQQTADSGFIIAGGIYLNDLLDVYLIKTDAAGSILWDTTYDDSGLEAGWSVQQTTDGGYVVAGLRYPSEIGTSDVYLLRTDSVGLVLWDSTYGGAMYQFGFSVQQTLDGGYIVTGETGDREYDTDLYLLKVDSTGSTLWERTFGWPGAGDEDRGYSVQQTSDGGYIIAGATASFGAYDCDIYLIKTNDLGLVERDVGVVSVEMPPDTVFTDSAYSPIATLQNFRPAVVACAARVTIGGFSDTTATLLRADSSRQVGFSQWQVPSTDSSIYTVTVCTYGVDDIDSTNNCLQKTIFAYDPTGVEEGYERPIASEFRLSENQPNPLQRSTSILYTLPHVSNVTLSIYDITGRLVETLVNETQQPGIHQVSWNRKDNPSGVYFCGLRAGEFTETRKMVVVE